VPANLYTITTVQGAKPSDRRGIAFLHCSTASSGVNALAAFEDLATKNDKRVRELRTRFDHWIEGQRNDRWFHGWPNDARRKNCGLQNRDREGAAFQDSFPSLPRRNPKFQLCVLISHAIKTQWETDPREVDAMEAFRINPQVIDAIRRAYPDSGNGKQRWINLNRHWTAATTEDFLYRIAADYVSQLERIMDASETSQTKLAERLKVSKGRVSQVLNNPGNLTLKKIVEYARALGKKVAIVV
jgi:plasmid maintenance system antidote protein VapI